MKHIQAEDRDNLQNTHYVTKLFTRMCLTYLKTIQYLKTI
jgi:hypothetical protein